MQMEGIVPQFRMLHVTPHYDDDDAQGGTDGNALDHEDHQQLDASSSCLEGENLAKYGAGPPLPLN